MPGWRTSPRPRCLPCPPPAICWTKPSCAATANFCWGCSSAPAARSCWRRRRSRTSTSIPCWPLIWQAPKPAASMRAASAGKRCPTRRTTCSALPTGPTHSTSCCTTPTTSSSTRPASWPDSARQPKRRARASGCASTRNARPRKATRSTTPAPPAAAWAPPVPSGTPLCRQTRPCRVCWTACTSTPCVSRIPTRWP